MSKYCFLLTSGKVRFLFLNVGSLAHQGWLREFISLKKELTNSVGNEFEKGLILQYTLLHIVCHT